MEGMLYEEGVSLTHVESNKHAAHILETERPFSIIVIDQKHMFFSSLLVCRNVVNNLESFQSMTLGGERSSCFLSLMPLSLLHYSVLVQKDPETLFISLS